MKKPIVFMFSGQGSQFYQMGKELFNQCPIFHSWMVKMDDIIKEQTGMSVIKELYGSKEKWERFDRTFFTHPAIFMVEYALAQVLLDRGIVPDYVLGTSLGEYTAAAVAGVIRVKAAIECLLTQAALLEEYCINSGMLAIVYDPKLYYENPVLFKNIEFAALNYDSHFVVAGESESLAKISDFLKDKEIIHQLLPVSFGFHSSYIDAIQAKYTSFLAKMSFHKPVFPFISSLNGEQLTELPVNYFWDVVRKPIQFQKAIWQLEKKHECIYLDLGPSGSLANFVKNNLECNSGSQYYPIITLFNQELKNLRRIEALFNDCP